MNSTLHFPPFALDPRRHVLTRDGGELPLSPHLVDILFHLVSRPGETVTKDALLEEFWPDVHVTENTLTRAIADIRKALGDDSTSPRFIQTVARRGYRFVAPITEHLVSAHGTGHLARDGALGTGNSAPNRAPGARHREPGTDSDPFREWMRGRLSLESLDATKLPEAVAAFEHMVDATPDYAPAHAGLANACFLQYERGRAENMPNREPLSRATVHAKRACELDQTLGEAWATLGFVLTAVGDVERARAAARRAAALEPTSWRHHFRLAIATWGEERLRAVDRTLALLPDFAPARFLAAMVFIARQAFAPALEAASAGAAAQARQTAHDESPFPAIGLQWLHGLLLLRSGLIGPAITAFAGEIDGAQDARIYGGEFRVNAQVAAGFAHLAARDPAGATDAFRSALETLPRNGRALIGLYQALSQTSLASEAPQLLPQIDRSISELTAGGRTAEAALINAALCAARGDAEGACGTLQRLLDAAPPGQIGWSIAVDPALASLRSHPEFEAILARLAARAA